MKRHVIFVAFVVAGCWAGSSLRGATLTVDLNGGADYTDIQSAIDAAADGDTVLVRPGEYVIAEPIDFNRLRDPVDPASPPVKNIVVRSEGGAKVTAIRVSEAGVVRFKNGESSTSVLGWFEVIGGYGGCVDCSENSSPTITNCTISGNGYGVSCSYESSPTLTNCTISGNVVGVDCSENSSPTLTNCTISGNGGGVECSENSSPTLTNCTISGNGGGGVGCSENSSPTLTNCTISGNGGGVYCSENSSPTLTNCVVWGNVGGPFSGEEGATPHVTFSCLETDTVFPGGGNINTDPRFCGFAAPAETFVDPASSEGGDGTPERPFRDLEAALEFRLSLEENSPCIGAGQDGANMGADLGTCDAAGPGEPVVVHLAPGHYDVEGLTLWHGASILGAGADRTVLEGTVWGLRTGATLSGVTITGGTSGGVVVPSGESPTLTDCTIEGNSGCLDGGGVYCSENSSPTLTNCTISGNYACRGGGGVYCSWNSSPTLTDCTIARNWGEEGGGVYCNGNSSPTLTDCTISRNSAWQGGGVYCDSSSPTLTNCTIAGNVVDGYEGDRGVGGGVYCLGNSSPTLTNCTIAENEAHGDRGVGGGVYCENSSPALTNCIVWGNTPESICGEMSRCLTDQDPLFMDPGLWEDCDLPNRENCVYVEDSWRRWVHGDYHLQPGSPCIDAGTSDGAPANDIEGNARPCGAGIDIGAYEFGDCWPSTRFTRGDSNADGTIDISDPVGTLGHLFLGTGAVQCLDAADANDSGQVDLSDAVYSLLFLFMGGPAPVAPFRTCGMDRTVDDLDCVTFPGCP